MRHVGHMLISSFKNIMLMLHSLMTNKPMRFNGGSRPALNHHGLEPPTNILLIWLISTNLCSRDVTKLVKICIRRMRISTYKFVRMRIRMRIPLKA